MKGSWLKFSDLNYFILNGILFTALTAVDLQYSWIKISVAFLALIFNLIGVNILTNKKMEQVQKESEERSKESERIALQNMSEMFNTVSDRTESDFIFEKIPRSMSYDEGKKLIDQAVNKFVKMIESENDGQMEDITLIRNSSEVSDGARVYFDIKTQDNIPGPDPPFYHVHVLLNLGTDEITEHNRYLATKYRKWYQKILGELLVGNIRFRHYIVVVKNSDKFESTDVDVYENWPTLQDYLFFVYDVRDDSLACGNCHCSAL